MSYRVYFELSTGLKHAVTVPAGWFERAMLHARQVENRLHIERDTDTGQWKRTKFEGVPDDVLCGTAEMHNAWVRHVYDELATYAVSPPQGAVEVVTPEKARELWPALHFIDVPPERWTANYYKGRMEVLFEVMTEGECNGISFDVETLTPEQAGMVVLLFAEFLDTHDIRLAVPRGYDFLARSDTGEYDWCEKHGEAIYVDDSCSEVATCDVSDCPLVMEYQELLVEGEIDDVDL